MGAPAFKIGPLTHYADPAQLEAWLAGAKPGNVVTYATGPYLGDHAAAACMRAAQAGGSVELFQERSDRAHCFEYKARKIAVRCERDGAGAATPGDVLVQPHQLPGEERQVYLFLLAEIEAGRPCPTNEAIADALDLETSRQARYRFDKLVEAGLVRVIEPARFGARVIELVLTGQRSAAEVKR